MRRLPLLRQADDACCVYVVEKDGKHKVGFTRKGLKRRVRNAGGHLVLTIPVTQRASVLEYIINNRFALKRLPPQGDKSGDKREWFKLDEADLEWLRGLAGYLRVS